MPTRASKSSQLSFPSFLGFISSRNQTAQDYYCHEEPTPMQPTEETNDIPTDYEVSLENLPPAAILENKAQSQSFPRGMITLVRSVKSIFCCFVASIVFKIFFFFFHMHYHFLN